MDRIIERKTISKRKIALAVLGIGIPVVFILVIIGSTGTKKITIDQSRIMTGTVIKGSFREFIPVTGNVQPVKTVMVDAVEGGTIKEILVEDGVMVQSGQPLLKLTNQQFQLETIQREAQLLEQQNNLRSAVIGMEDKSNRLRDELLQLKYQFRSALRRHTQQQVLFRDSLTSKNEYEAAKEEVELLRSQMDLLSEELKKDSIFRKRQLTQIESSLQLIDRNLEYLSFSLENLIIRAPIAGQLSSLNADLGQTTIPGQNIAQIDQIHDFKVTARVGEHYLPRVFPGQEAYFDQQGTTYHLSITKIYPEVTGGEFEVDLVFSGNKPAAIRRGQSLQLRLALGDQAQALLLPRGGFYQDTGGNYVYLIRENNSAYRQAVTLGRQNPDYYEVLEGLTEGDVVIISRYKAFNNADEVIIDN